MNFAQLPLSLPLGPLLSTKQSSMNKYLPDSPKTSLPSLVLDNGGGSNNSSSSGGGTDTSSSSPVSSTPGNARGYDHGISGQKVIDEIGLTDKDLIRIKTKDLNQLLKGVPKNRQKEIKSERRTYKNRIYADNCRKKRLHEKEQLENYLGDVTQDMERIQQEIHKNRYKIMGYIKSCDTLLRSLDKYDSGPEMKKKIKEEIWKENASELKHNKELFDKLGERDFEKT